MTGMATRITVVLALVIVLLAAPSLLAQSAAALPLASPPTSNEFQGGMIWAFLSASCLEWLKRHPSLTLLSERTSWGAQRALGVLMAIAAAIGVHWSFDADAGALTISGLFLPSIWTIGVESLRQFCQQEVLYRVAVKNYDKKQGVRHG